jgi:hypothetical protein
MVPFPRALLLRRGFLPLVRSARDGNRCRKMKIRWIVASLLCAAVAIAVVVMYSVVKQPSIFAQRDSLLAIARQYPNSTRAQRMAILREKELEMHPQWRDL